MIDYDAGVDSKLTFDLVRRRKWVTVCNVITLKVLRVSNTASYEKPLDQKCDLHILQRLQEVKETISGWAGQNDGVGYRLIRDLAFINIPQNLQSALKSIFESKRS